VRAIEEHTAWEILYRYVGDCLSIDADSLVAIYATGSLPGGYYRPGQSDIDAALIVENGSEAIWGDLETGSEPLRKLNRRYLETYLIPKDFGPFPLQIGELSPPYDPRFNVLTMEIARLKVQGQCVYGSFNLGAVPMPTAEDFLKEVQRFEEWLRDEFFKATPLETISAMGCVNIILMHLSRFLRIKRGIVEFNKRKLVQRYLESEPPFVHDAAFRLVEAHLASQVLDRSEEESLRQYAGTLREQMNEHLGISL